MEIVTEFTRRELTFTSDKLPALAGLASLFDKTLNATYLAGIWRMDPFIWEAIPWSTGPYLAGNLLPKPGPPSWSWASIDGTIEIAPGTSWFGELDGGALLGRKYSSVDLIHMAK
jgi:hypothetical protein